MSTQTRSSVDSTSELQVLHSSIRGEPAEGAAGTTRAVDPKSGAATGPEFSLLGRDQLADATNAAKEAFDVYRKSTPDEIARLLNAIADQVESRRETIVSTAQTETGLPEGRLQGELTRTVNQIRMFATVATRGDHLGVRIEEALPDRTPLPRPDLRQIRIPLGPVGVFGASNFPLAFSVAGGDTASALAAGCPVVVKAHNAHPATSHLVGEAVNAGIAEVGAHPGIFSLVFGRGKEIGQELASDPRIRAIGFTGSRSGGTSLMETAAARPAPIPVYAEMSSVNPVFVLPSAIGGEAAASELAAGFVGSLNGSAGQLCTAPGLLFVPTGKAGDDFVNGVAEKVSEADGQTMLTPGICAARVDGEERLSAVDGVKRLARGNNGASENSPAPSVYTTDVGTYRAAPELSEEVFGAVCLIVRYDGIDELRTAAKGVSGELTATVHLNEADHHDIEVATELIDILAQGVGRIVFNAWPTGVDVGDAMVHGGPFPATSDGRSTSVGAAAIERFLRPVVIQGSPEAVRPPAVRASNPWRLTRRMDGVVVLPDSAEGAERDD